MTKPSSAPTSGPTQRRSFLSRPSLRLLLIAVAVGLSSASANPPATAAEICPNATLREQNNSTELPECRAYEMVSSPYKQGFDLERQAFSDDGLVNYFSAGSFAGNGLGLISNEYMGVRTGDGWETRSLNPPGESFETIFQETATFASDLRSSVVAFVPRKDPSGEGNGFYVRDFNGTFTRVGRGPVPNQSQVGENDVLSVLATSDDLSHLVFGGETGWLGLEYVGVGEAAVLRQENVDNNGNTLPETSCAPPAISGDGRVLVFGCAQAKIWARVGGATTVAVSGSECTRGPSDPGGVCNGPSGAAYAGSAGDGSRVFFTTSQQLVNGDIDQTKDLYACDIPPGTPGPVGTANPCASLTEISGAATGANVQSVVAVSEDGSRVYFVAEGAVLAPNAGANDETAVAGNRNLYVWTKDPEHPAGTTAFVGAIDTNGITRAQTTADGRYLVFATTSALVTRGPGEDTDERFDVYRYDAKSQMMQRVSTSVTDSGGNAPGFDALPSGMSANGSMVVFETAEALSPQDIDGVTDVYLWHDGRVSLISHGGGEHSGIDASGQNIYFVTDRPLTAGDRDVNVDIYDARIDGGFDLSRQAPCSGDACQGPSSTPPVSAGAPGSETLQGAGNPPQPLAAEHTKPKPLTRQQKLAKALKLCRKQPKHKRLACERQARKRYAPLNRSARRSHR